MNAYTPNFTDPRVRRRCEIAIEFIERYIGDEPVPVAQSQIIKFFGNQATSLGLYLKQQLLFCTDNHYNMLTGKCKQYRRNRDGLQLLRQAINPRAKITPKLQQQLDTGEFDLTEIGDRFYNPLQSLPRYKRDELLYNNGYRYEYDIQCAAPTLLYQYAQKLDPSLKLEYVEYYISNRSLVRSELSIKHNITEEKIKVVITALFQGAYLSLNDKTRIFHLLDGNYGKIQQLKTDSFVQSLRDDLKVMWKVIGDELKQIKLRDLVSIDRDQLRDIFKLTGRKRIEQLMIITERTEQQLRDIMRITGRDKAGLYRKLEREVMSVIRKELKKTGNCNLPIHDGWNSREICDMKKLVDLVRNKTGYLIRIDWAILSQ